jgi:CheY-like chemotaxis protein
MSRKKLTGKPAVILLVEDNPAHAELIMRSFEEYQIANQIYHVMDGEAALNYLHQQEEFADPEVSPRPDVILLDLRLPKIDGLEVLQAIKATDTLKAIPVVVLTTSKAEMDVAKAYDQHVNSYLVKPVDFTEFAEMMRDLGLYWLCWNFNPQ